LQFPQDQAGKDLTLPGRPGSVSYLRDREYKPGIPIQCEHLALCLPSVEADWTNSFDCPFDHPKWVIRNSGIPTFDFLDGLPTSIRCRDGGYTKSLVQFQLAIETTN
jgi:hypothetical protein